MVLSTCSWRPCNETSALQYAQDERTYMEASSAKLDITARKPIQAIRKEYMRPAGPPLASPTTKKLIRKVLVIN